MKILLIKNLDKIISKSVFGGSLYFYKFGKEKAMPTSSESEEERLLKKKLAFISTAERYGSISKEDAESQRQELMEEMGQKKTTELVAPETIESPKEIKNILNSKVLRTASEIKSEIEQMREELLQIKDIQSKEYNEKFSKFQQLEKELENVIGSVAEVDAPVLENLESQQEENSGKISVAKLTDGLMRSNDFKSIKKLIFSDDVFIGATVEKRIEMLMEKLIKYNEHNKKGFNESQLRNVANKILLKKCNIDTSRVESEKEPAEAETENLNEKIAPTRLGVENGDDSTAEKNTSDESLDKKESKLGEINDGVKEYLTAKNQVKYLDQNIFEIGKSLMGTTDNIFTTISRGAIFNITKKIGSNLLMKKGVIGSHVEEVKYDLLRKMFPAKKDLDQESLEQALNNYSGGDKKIDKLKSQYDSISKKLEEYKELIKQKEVAEKIIEEFEKDEENIKKAKEQEKIIKKLNDGELLEEINEENIGLILSILEKKRFNKEKLERFWKNYGTIAKTITVGSFAILATVLALPVVAIATATATTGFGAFVGGKTAWKNIRESKGLGKNIKGENISNNGNRLAFDTEELKQKGNIDELKLSIQNRINITRKINSESYMAGGIMAVAAIGAGFASRTLLGAINHHQSAIEIASVKKPNIFTTPHEPHVGTENISAHEPHVINTEIIGATAMKEITPQTAPEYFMEIDTSKNQIDEFYSAIASHYAKVSPLGERSDRLSHILIGGSTVKGLLTDNLKEYTYIDPSSGKKFIDFTKIDDYMKSNINEVDRDIRNTLQHPEWFDGSADKQASMSYAHPDVNQIKATTAPLASTEAIGVSPETGISEADAVSINNKIETITDVKAVVSTKINTEKRIADLNSQLEQLKKDLEAHNTGGNSRRPEYQDMLQEKSRLSKEINSLSESLPSDESVRTTATAGVLRNIQSDKSFLPGDVQLESNGANSVILVDKATSNRSVGIIDAYSKLTFHKAEVNDGTLNTVIDNNGTTQATQIQDLFGHIDKDNFSKQLGEKGYEIVGMNDQNGMDVAVVRSINSGELGTVKFDGKGNAIIEYLKPENYKVTDKALGVLNIYESGKGQIKDYLTTKGFTVINKSNGNVMTPIDGAIILKDDKTGQYVQIITDKQGASSAEIINENAVIDKQNSGFYSLFGGKENLIAAKKSGKSFDEVYFNKYPTADIKNNGVKLSQDQYREIYDKLQVDSTKIQNQPNAPIQTQQTINRPADFIKQNPIQSKNSIGHGVEQTVTSQESINTSPSSINDKIKNLEGTISTLNNQKNLSMAPREQLLFLQELQKVKISDQNYNLYEKINSLDSQIKELTKNAFNMFKTNPDGTPVIKDQAVYDELILLQKEEIELRTKLTPEVFDMITSVEKHAKIAFLESEIVRMESEKVDPFYIDMQKNILIKLKNS